MLWLRHAFVPEKVRAPAARLVELPPLVEGHAIAVGHVRLQSGLIGGQNARQLRADVLGPRSGRPFAAARSGGAARARARARSPASLVAGGSGRAGWRRGLTRVPDGSDRPESRARRARAP